MRFCCGAGLDEFRPISCQEIGRLPGNGSVNRSTDLMAKLLRHLGLGGKKSPSQQPRQEYSVQGLQSKAQGTDRCSGIVDEGGRFDSLREDTRRHSECSTRTLTLSFDSAATRERDWSLRGPNSKYLPPISCPADDPLSARIDLPGPEEVGLVCPTPTVASEFAAGEESAKTSQDIEVQLSSDYSNPYDLKKEIAEAVETTIVACVMEQSSEDDYSVPYELKKHFKDLQMEEEPAAVAMKPKYDDPYELNPPAPSPSTVQPTSSGQPVSLGHYRNLPMVTSSVSADFTHNDASSVLAAPTVTKPPEATCVANNGEERKAEDPGADDDDHENYMDLQEEEIFQTIEVALGRTASSSFREPCVNNYDEPWDLANTRRDLEERLRAMQKLDASAARRSAERAPPPLMEVADDRPQEGYDKPWDLQPHMKDDRGQEGYDKPWDLKPHLKDMRPAQEYEMPWDKKARDIERDLFAAKRAKDAAAKGGDGLALASGRATPPSVAGLPPSRLDASRMADTRPVSEYDEPWDQKKKKLVCKAASEHALMSGHFPSFPAGLPFPQQMPGASVGLPFPQQVPSSRGSSQWGKTIGERIDPKVPLEQQSWYHGSISRVDAENLLRVHREGSYLVRTSESNKLDYSLSVKSIRGFMHMKIVTNAEGRYILGQFSQPFYSIPQMIYHYTVNKLPIKGAEHMSLMYPISNELL